MILGDFEAARHFLTTACELAAGEGGCLGCEANARDRLARALLADKYYRLALPHAQRAATLYHLLHDFMGEAHCHFLLVTIHAQLGNPEAFEDSLVAIKRAGLDFAANRQQLPIAVAEGHFPTSESEISTPLNEADLRFTAHFKNFTNLFERHEYTLALAAWEAWRPAVEAMNRSQLEAEALGLRGRCHMGLKDFDAAIQNFEQGLSLARSVPKDDLEAELVRDLALAYNSKFADSTGLQVWGF
jgi:tetratricopeptide (TPR) repeat protein